MIDRNKLDKIILKNNTNDWWQPKLFVENTLHLLPYELEIVKYPPKENWNYNCFIYALGLAEDQELILQTKGFIYDNFIKKLLDEGKLEKTENPSDGDFVVYQDLENYPNSLTHIGIIDGDKVISKWSWGPLVKHNLWDVPASYGDTIFYIKAIDAKDVLRLFSTYKEFNIKQE